MDHKIKFDYKSIEQHIPEDVFGVYSFWNSRTNRCLYIGCAHKRPIKKRLLDHLNEAHNTCLRSWIKGRTVLEVCYLVVPDDEKTQDSDEKYISKLIKRIEKKYIHSFGPECNIQHSSNKSQ